MNPRWTIRRGADVYAVVSYIDGQAVPVEVSGLAESDDFARILADEALDLRRPNGQIGMFKAEGEPLDVCAWLSQFVQDRRLAGDDTFELDQENVESPYSPDEPGWIY